jgi:serine/threonine protein kinase
VAQGLEQLHGLNIVHNDVKPHNCLLKHKDNYLKLADLANSVQLLAGMYITPYLT